MTYGSTFTGIGGFDLGFDQAGLEELWQVECDKDCNRVLRRHWSAGSRGEFVEECNPKRFVRPDVICGGFPCQDLSVAGRRAGLAGERSGLWHEFHRVIAEFKPSVCVVENVPGIFSSNGGKDFLTVIRGLEELGYCVGWTVLDSQYFGVAQRRERVFIVGSIGNGSCAQILFESESVRGDTAPSRETRESASRDVALCLNSGRDGYNDGSDQTYIPDVAVTLQGVSPNGGSPHNADQTFIPEVAWALQERDSKGPDSDTKDGHLVAVAYHTNDGGTVKRKDRPNGGFYVNETETSLTVGSPNKTIAAVQWASGGGKLENDSAQALRSQAEHNYQFARVGTSVRRLTPRECERLQGFPDDWTRWDAEGKEISDSARYRMLGNAVTVPVAKWLGQRIMQYAE